MSPNLHRGASQLILGAYQLALYVMSPKLLSEPHVDCSSTHVQLSFASRMDKKNSKILILSEKLTLY